jgi:hypothetical protein
MQQQEPVGSTAAGAAAYVIRGHGTQAAEILVSDERLVVTEGDRLALDIGFEQLRRVQFDIERDMPATLVIVPDRPIDQPQVLFVPPAEFPLVAQALVTIGRRLQDVSERKLAHEQGQPWSQGREDDHDQVGGQQQAPHDHVQPDVDGHDSHQPVG